jgi:hypothetical protein
VIPKQKQLELQRYRAILLATTDYLISKHGGSIVFDGEDSIRDYYEQQKPQIEKYYEQRRLNKLQQKLLSLSKGLQNKPDINFTTYIKEKTGYDIDIYEDLRKRVDAVVEQEEIRNEKELNDVFTMLGFYQQTSTSDEMVDKVRALLTDHSKKIKSIASGKKESDHTEIIRKVEEDGMEKVTIRISTGPKPKHLEEQEAISPDGKRRLRITQWSKGKHASTYVNIMFPTTSGVIYGINGICPDVKASWKGNATIVIQTNKNYTANTQHKEVRSFDDIITIEYIAH